MCHVIRFPLELRIGSPAAEQPTGTLIVLPPREATPIEPDDGYALQALVDVLKPCDSE